MKVVIAGGSGFLGRIVTRAMARKGYEVVILSRQPDEDSLFRTVRWDSRTLSDWGAEVDGADVVVNLAGRSVNCRYSARNRDEIMVSRVDSARVIGQAIALAARPPRVWLQASTATIYSHRYDAANDEYSGAIGGGEPDAPRHWRFSIEVARAWEREIDDVFLPRTRKVKLRSAIVMSPDAGGVLAILRNLARVGLGGAAGDGRQYVSWIHAEDFVRALFWLIDHEGIDGAVNLAAPNPLPNEEFMRAIREACEIEVGLSASRWMLELGAFFLRTETELLLKSRRVTPARLVTAGFVFNHPHWPEAARDLIRRVGRSGRELSRLNEGVPIY